MLPRTDEELMLIDLFRYDLSINSNHILIHQNLINGNKKRETKWLPFFIIVSIKNLLYYDLFNLSKVLTDDSYKIDSTSVSS